MAEATAERMRLGLDILTALAHAVAANEETQRRFRTAVLIRLSKIETKLTEIQGAQLADFWAPGKVTDAKRAEYVRELEERISRASNEMGLKMVKFVYGGLEALEPEPKARRKRREDLSYEI